MTWQFQRIILSVILIVLSLLLLPIVIDGVGDVLAINGVSAYNGVESVVGLIPLLVVVGMVIVAILNGLWAIRGGGGDS